MGRRIGRIEQHDKILANFQTSQHESLLMGMLVDEGAIMDPIATKPRRKQGIVVQHPIDVIDQLDINENKNKLYSFATDWSCLERSRSSLIREGSTRSSNGSRKSSVKSFRSTSTVRTTNSAKIRRNSGTFDGWNVRKTSRERKTSASSQHKISISAQRDEILAAFYKNMERQLENESTSSSGSDGEEMKKKLNNRMNIDDVDYTTRTTEYVMKHAVNASDISDEGVQTDELLSSNSLKVHSPEGRHEKACNSVQDNTTTSTKRTSKSSGFTNHSEINSKRLTELIFEDNANGSSNKFDSMPKPKATRTHSLPAARRSNSNNSNMRDLNTIRERAAAQKTNHARKRNLKKHDSDTSISTDSARGSTHSISSLSSDGFQTSRHDLHRPSVPMNFIPGYTSPLIGRQRNGSLPISLSYFRKVSFCFKGVTCRIFQNMPKTHRALAHAGCVGLVIPAPASHRCKH